MNKAVILALVLLLCSLGCSKPTAPSDTSPPVRSPAATPAADPTSAEMPVGDTTQTSVDWAGTYKGTLPCEDCDGIEVEVVLNDDGTFQRTATYLGKEGEPEVSDGSFTWKEDGATIVLSGGEESMQYWVSEGRIVQLDAEGNKIEGEMADKYVLQKS